LAGHRWRERKEKSPILRKVISEEKNLCPCGVTRFIGAARIVQNRENNRCQIKPKEDPTCQKAYGETLRFLSIKGRDSFLLDKIMKLDAKTRNDGNASDCLQSHVNSAVRQKSKIGKKRGRPAPKSVDCCRRKGRTYVL